MWGDRAFRRQRRDAPPGQGGPTASPNEGAGKGGDSSMDNKNLVLDGLTPLAASPPADLSERAAGRFYISHFQGELFKTCRNSGGCPAATHTAEAGGILPQPLEEFGESEDCHVSERYANRTSHVTAALF